MGGIFGGKPDTSKQEAQARRNEQRANEDEQRAKQRGERGGGAGGGAAGGRGRNLLVGRLGKVLPSNLGGVAT